MFFTCEVLKYEDSKHTQSPAQDRLLVSAGGGHLSLYILFSMDEGHPFVTFTDESTSEVFKVRSDLIFFHIYSENKKNIDGEGHVMLTV